MLRTIRARTHSARADRSRGGRRRGTRSRHGRARERAGFTLIELLVTMMLLQVGILALMAVMPLTERQVARANRESHATQLLRQQLETLTRRAYEDSLLAPGASHLDPANPIDGRFERSWMVTEDQPVAGCKTITVLVAWPDLNRERQISASTVLARY